LPRVFHTSYKYVDEPKSVKIDEHREKSISLAGFLVSFDKKSILMTDEELSNRAKKKVSFHDNIYLPTMRKSAENL